MWPLRFWVNSTPPVRLVGTAEAPQLADGIAAERRVVGQSITCDVRAFGRVRASQMQGDEASDTRKRPMR